MREIVLHKVVEQLLGEVDQRWARDHYDEGAFPEVSAQALQTVDLSPFEDIVKLIRWLNQNNDLPGARAGENDFAYPTMTLARTPRFRIELLCWTGMPAHIHDHVSPGAFTLIRGSRLHNRYRFEAMEQLDDGFHHGRLELTCAELLTRGDVCPIGIGPALIHSSAFLDTPAVTISIRSQTREGAGHLYERPGIRYDRTALNLHQRKRLETLGALRMADPEHFEEHIINLGRAAGPRSLFILLQHLESNLPPAQMNSILQALRQDRAELVDRMVTTLREHRRRRTIEQHMARPASEDWRYLLALLWAPVDRRRSQALLRQRFPQIDPNAIYELLARQAATVKEDANTSGAADLFGILWQDPAPLIVQHLLAGHTAAETTEKLKESYRSADVERLLPELQKMVAALQRHPVLGYWFATEQSQRQTA